MAGSLSTSQINAFHEDGFLMPLRGFTEAQAQAFRTRVEDLEARYPTGSLPQPLNQYFRVNGHVVLPFLVDIATQPPILDAAESILGPDLLLWSVEFFIKEAGSEAIVSWHQDITYWGMEGTYEQISAWIALTNVTEQSGCMRFVPGSHKQNLVEHRDTFAANNLLSRGQELAVDVDEDEAVLDELRPGEFSLHHGRMFHASGPNRSDDRRIGMVVRFITPQVATAQGTRDFAMVVRGCDTVGNRRAIAPPAVEFGAAELALYDRILAEQAGTLGAGAEDKINYYGR